MFMKTSGDAPAMFHEIQDMMPVLVPCPHKFQADCKPSQSAVIRPELGRPAMVGSTMKSLKA
ncbi:hypothetical protein [Polymorphobacter multimanifer]|uniref:Uncharacterized protein n=1 Tax=Polymorphobacter multimanifer TaxID=1070431 RepID=A0A841L0M8_9SPHN|nr:hypothetical protein [Polymorphobacter multimanifer]MBB6226104.1 hypothetical protein [Polymorphobacter multimanifer]